MLKISISIAVHSYIDISADGRFLLINVNLAF